MRVVVDDTEHPPYTAIVAESLTFSPNGQRLAYGAAVGTQMFVVVDGQEGPRYDALVADSLRFSPDSQRLAYGARQGQQWSVVLDGQPGQALRWHWRGQPGL